MTNEAVFTKRAAGSGQGFLFWIPKNIVDFLSLSEESFVEAKIRKLEKGDESAEKTAELTFVKRISRSGRGLLLWVPKDVSDYLSIGSGTFCEIRIKHLGDKR